MAVSTLFAFTTVYILWHNDVINVVDSLILPIAFVGFLAITSSQNMKQEIKIDGAVLVRLS